MTAEPKPQKLNEKDLYEVACRFFAFQEKKPLFDYFNKFKNKFYLYESFKVKGKVCEFYRIDVTTKSGYDTTYSVILSDNKLISADRSNTFGNISTFWDKLIGVAGFSYHNGCPHYSFVDASIIEIIKTDRNFLEFHKMHKSRVKGNPLKENFEQIPNTVYSIGQPTMYRTGKDGKNEFFYDDSYRIRMYDIEYNLSKEKRFNTRFLVVESTTKIKAIDRLLQSLEKDKDMEVKGSWNHGNMPFIWCEPNPAEEAKIQLIIDAVKLFREGL